MFLVGLTGGIASGKSTVSRLLGCHGAAVVDADVIAREVVEPGAPALAAIVERFGNGVLRSDGSLDRERLGAIAFSDPEANADLRAITHPEIGRVIGERMTALAGTDRVVILDAALLVETARGGLAMLIVVAADLDVQVERMMRDRALSRAEAEARIASQAPLADKLAAADLVVWKKGTIDELEARVVEEWAEVLERKAGGWGAG